MLDRSANTAAVRSCSLFLPLQNVRARTRRPVRNARLECFSPFSCASTRTSLDASPRRKSVSTMLAKLRLARRRDRRADGKAFSIIRLSRARTCGTTCTRGHRVKFIHTARATSPGDSSCRFFGIFPVVKQILFRGFYLVYDEFSGVCGSLRWERESARKGETVVENVSSHNFNLACRRYCPSEQTSSQSTNYSLPESTSGPYCTTRCSRRSGTGLYCCS